MKAASDFLPLDEMHEDAADHGRVHKPDLRTARAGTADGIDGSVARRFDPGETVLNRVRRLEGDMVQPGATAGNVAGDRAAVAARRAGGIVARLVRLHIGGEILDEFKFCIAHRNKRDAHAAEHDLVVTEGQEGCLRRQARRAIRRDAVPSTKGVLGGSL